MEAATRAEGLVAGESCVQLGAGNVGELAPTGIIVAIENVSEAMTARRATGNRLTPMACILKPRNGLTASLLCPRTANRPRVERHNHSAFTARYLSWHTPAAI